MIPILYVLVSLVCGPKGCELLQPQPPRMEFSTLEACEHFAMRAVKEGGNYACMEDEGS